MRSAVEYLRFGSGYRKNGAGDSLFRQVFGLTSMHTRIRALHLLRFFATRPPQGPVLEVGFGEGYLLLALARNFPGLRFEGWEVTARQVERAQERARLLGIANVSFREADISGPAEPAPAFGCVYAIDVLEHIADDAHAMDQMAGLLLPGGRLVIHVPLRGSLQRRFLPGFSGHSDPGHVRPEYTPEELCRLVDGAGLSREILRHTFGVWGELCFEMNSFFWRWRRLDSLWRAVTMPPLLPFGFLDAIKPLSKGNSLLLAASKAAE